MTFPHAAAAVIAGLKEGVQGVGCFVGLGEFDLGVVVREFEPARAACPTSVTASMRRMDAGRRADAGDDGNTKAHLTCTNKHDCLGPWSPARRRRRACPL